MTQEQQKVKDFMQKFGQETLDKPCIPSLEVRKLRAKLIMEEAIETISALGIAYFVDVKPNTLNFIDNYMFLGHEELRNQDQFPTEGFKGPNLIEIADGLADLHYVGYCGTAVACGLNMEPIFAEVHRSNMSKLWTDLEWCNIDANDNDYIATPITICAINQNARIWLVKNKDGKVIKSPSYSPANLKDIIYGPLQNSN